MVTTYILVLTLSAWLMSHGLVLVSSRVVPVLGLSTPKSLIALGVAIAMLTVVAAPGWLLLLAMGVAALPVRNMRLDFGLPTMVPWFIALLLLILLCLGPVIGGPSYLAIDAALMGASLLGILTVSKSLPVLGRAFPAYLVLIVGIMLTVVIHHGLRAA